MIKNYFKVAWRNLLKNKVFSFINITGLAVGLASFLLIALYVLDELSYDRYNEKADRIYRVNTDIKFGGGDLHLTVASDPMGAVLKKDYPQVVEYTRIYNSSGSKLIKKGSQYINEEKVAHVDSTFFKVFTLPAVSGNTDIALNEPNTVVLTESASKKYFNTTDAVGEILEIEKTPYKVTAVIRDIPRASHFNFDVLLSMDNVDYQWGNFLSNNFQTYIVLQKGIDYKEFEKNFTTVIDKYLLPQAKQFMQINSMEDFKKAGNKLEYTLMPLTDIHLHSDRFPELSANGNIQYVYIFSAVALFILLIACINFMNLSTARSANRAKEVGIRKVLGTEKKALVNQFLFESIITVTIALVIAIGIASLVLPLFNDVSTKSFTVKDFFTGKFIPFLVALPFVVGILAGSYPAFFLSGFKPITVLKGNTASIFKRSHLRSGLVVFQFATSIFLIISTVIVYSQLHYIQTKNLGFNKDQVLIINGTGALENNAEAFKNEVSNLPGVSSGSFTGYLPVSSSARNDNSFSKTAVMDSKTGINMQRWTIDYDYIKTLGMQMVRGRNFSREFGSDSSGVIINETTEKLLAFDNPIGQKIYTYNENNEPISYNIIGVVRNFNFESLRQNIGPLCMVLGKSPWITSFKVSTANIQSLVKQIESKWKAMAPGMAFSYRFLDDSFDEMYRDEQRVGKIAITFALLAILIACLGLFGLVTYAAERRVKEIGIRKVLGATVGNIITMLSKDFLKLVIIAAIFSFPLAWWTMNKWLEDFAYRINISWWVFAIAAIVAASIALITVGLQAVRAALANPVKNLRTE
jgi:putative ABC transport system permease protein